MQEAMQTPHWSVISAVPHEDYTIDLEFADGKQGVYDATPLLEWPIFAPLKNMDFFLQAHVEYGSVAWSDKLDIAPESLYEKSVPRKEVATYSSV